MGDVVKLPQKPVCTNIWTTCTFDACPLKALAASMGPTAYLGNCSSYLLRHVGRGKEGGRGA